MSRIVAGLVREKLVRRDATEDARRVRLTATLKGEKILWKGRKRRVEMLANALKLLPATQMRQLGAAASLLQEMIRVL